MKQLIIENKYSDNAWLAGLGQPVADRLLAWEQQQSDALLTDVFGYHALQLGWPALQALRDNRMPHRWQARPEYASGTPDALDVDVSIDSRAWPFPDDTLDLVVLPHALERSADPHACLREVERVLIPEGHVLITGLNPLSCWGLRQSNHARRLSRTASTDGKATALIGYRRLRDWLRLLGFEVQVSRFGGWTPALHSEPWMQRLRWMDTVGERWCPVLGGVYLILATKRVPGGLLLDGRSWRTVRSPASATVPVARSDTSIGRQTAPKDIVESR